MSKRADNYNCEPCNGICIRTVIREVATGKRFIKITRLNGYSIIYGGRKIGLCFNNGYWVAIDLLTGVRIEKTKYKRRGNLINYLKKGIQKWRIFIKEHTEDLKRQQETLNRLKELEKFGKMAKCQ